MLYGEKDIHGEPEIVATDEFNNPRPSSALYSAGPSLEALPEKSGEDVVSNQSQ